MRHGLINSVLKVIDAAPESQKRHTERKLETAISKDTGLTLAEVRFLFDMDRQGSRRTTPKHVAATLSGYK